MVDFYPKASGKEGAAAYLMQKFGVPAGRCALLCDDDNDLELAAIVGKAFLPSIGAVSMHRAVLSITDLLLPYSVIQMVRQH